MNRRRFLEVAIGTPFVPSVHGAAAKPLPYEALFTRIEDDPELRISGFLNALPRTRGLPLASGFRGISPMPARYAPVAEGVWRAEYSPTGNFGQGLRAWLDSLGAIRAARFFVLAGDLVRYEIASGNLEYRVGLWEQTWRDGKLVRFAPIEEMLVKAPKPLFQDVTAHAFGGVDSFEQQLARGVPYWRARLDSAAGIDVYGNNGVAAGDIDNDGCDEIYVCQPGGLPNRLYKNRGDGSFEDITGRAGVGVLDETASALFLDVRNSGFQDLVVLRASGPLLFLNQGDGTFRHKSDAFQFAGAPQGTFTGMAAADYDRDGRVDLYLCSYIYFQSEDQYRYPSPYHDAQNGPPNFLFRNGGDGTFIDATADAGLSANNNRYSFAAAWCDYDGDGWPDLYVANDFGRNNLYKNNGGHFRDIAAEAGVEDIGPGMSASWFDYDGDGRPDLYVSNMWSDAGQRTAGKLAPREAYRRHAKGNSLYRNRGDGTFEETGATQGVEMGRWAWSSDGIDFDNDGVPEIYIASGMITNASPIDLNSFFWREVVARSPREARPTPAYENGWNALNQLIREDYSWNGREPNVLYVRRGGRYYDFSGVSGIDFAEDSRAFAVTDIDGDGNLDLILKSRLGPQVRVFRNDCGVERQAIALRLRGTRSNRDAIGTRVEVDGQVKFVQAGSGYLSQHTKQLHFATKSPAAVRVVWPSGLKQEFQGLQPRFRHELTEGSTEVKSSPFRTRKPMRSAPVKGQNEPRLEATWLLEPVPLPEPKSGPGLISLSAAEAASAYGILRRYLFDWRAPLKLPAAFLIDEQGRAHKFYPGLPDELTVRKDLALMCRTDRERLALPFEGVYYSRPRRNYFRFGAAFFWSGYPEEALQYLKEVVRRDPENFTALLATGQIHLDAGRDAEAKPALERALAVRPDHADAANQLGLLYAREKRHREARKWFQRAIESQRNHAGAINNLGVLYMEMGQPGDAAAAFLYGIEVAPDDETLYLNLGRVYVAQGERERARDVMRRLLAHKPESAIAARALEDLSR